MEIFKNEVSFEPVAVQVTPNPSGNVFEGLVDHPEKFADALFNSLPNIEEDQFSFRSESVRSNQLNKKEDVVAITKDNGPNFSFNPKSLNDENQVTNCKKGNQLTTSTNQNIVID